MNLYQFKAKMPRHPEPFQDYERAETLPEACERYKATAAQYKFPWEQGVVECVRVDPDTLQPIAGEPVAILSQVN